MTKTLLVLAPHTDDGELGAGGTIRRLVDDGWDCHYVAFSVGTALDREVMAAMRHIGVGQGQLILSSFSTRFFHERRQDILQIMIELRKEIRPDLVFVPASTDIHQDHEVINREAVRAFKHCSILGYELPWNNRAFSCDVFYRLGQEHVTAKWSAIQCYGSQRNRPYHDRPFVYGLAHVRGVQVGHKYAEAFEVIRWVQ